MPFIVLRKNCNLITKQSLHTCWTDCCPSTPPFALPNLPHRCGAESQLFFYLETLKQIKAAVCFYCLGWWVCEVCYKALSWTWRMRHRERWSYHLWGPLILLYLSCLVRMDFMGKQSWLETCCLCILLSLSIMFHFVKWLRMNSVRKVAPLCRTHSSHM